MDVLLFDWCWEVYGLNGNKSVEQVPPSYCLSLVKSSF